MHFAARKRRVLAGFTIIEALAVLFVLVVMAGLILHVSNGDRCKRDTTKCINNLKNVGLAVRIFATDNAEQFPWEVPVAEGGVGLLPTADLIGRVESIVGSFDLKTTNEPIWTWPSGLRFARFFSTVH